MSLVPRQFLTKISEAIYIRYRKPQPPMPPPVFAALDQRSNAKNRGFGPLARDLTTARPCCERVSISRDLSRPLTFGYHLIDQ